MDAMAAWQIPGPDTVVTAKEMRDTNGQICLGNANVTLKIC